MNNACIYSIDITTNSDETLSISSDDFENLYIANLDEKGDEVSYTCLNNGNSLYANFMMVKLLCNTKDNRGYIDRLSKQKDIAKIALRFTNGVTQEFDLPKKRIVTNGIMENKYQTIFFKDKDLCIIICDKKIKFTENLFI